MRQWTDEQRRLQAERIRDWQPWKKAGVKSEGGKKASSRNALKHGARSQETKDIHAYLSACSHFVKWAEEKCKVEQAIMHNQKLQRLREVTNELISLAGNKMP